LAGGLSELAGGAKLFTGTPTDTSAIARLPGEAEGGAIDPYTGEPIEQVQVTGAAEQPVLPGDLKVPGPTQKVGVTGTKDRAFTPDTLASTGVAAAPGTTLAPKQTVSVTGKAEKPITPETVDVTGTREFQAQPVDVTGTREFAAEPVTVTGQKEFVAEPVDVTGQKLFEAEPVEVTGQKLFEAEPVEVTGQKLFEAQPVEVTGKKEFVAEPVDVTGTKEKPLLPEDTVTPADQTKPDLFISSYVSPKGKTPTTVSSITPPFLRSPLEQALSAYTPPGEIESPATGKPRQNVWNVESLRNALGL
jgi:hypothetical protein